MMGCPLRCPWCCNPENLPGEPYEVNGIKYGKEYEYDELIEIIMRDKEYYKDGGGVTFSGGECILTLSRHIELLKKLKVLNINIAIETSLSAKIENLDEIVKYVDTVYIDLKTLDSQKYKKILFGNIEHYLSNLKTISGIKLNNLIFRIPIVGGFNDGDGEIEKVTHFLIQNNLKKNVEIFSVHNLGKDKYIKLSKKYVDQKPVSNEVLQHIKNTFEEYGFNIKINRI